MFPIFLKFGLQFSSSKILPCAFLIREFCKCISVFVCACSLAGDYWVSDLNTQTKLID